LIDDLLTVLFWPEWPAASLILTIASKFMVSSLDDVKTNSQTDSNAAKTIALDHLGVIAARIRTSILKVQQETRETTSRKALKPLDEIVSSVNIKHLNKFLDAHRDVASHLSKRSSEDQAYDSARELTAAMLGQELAAALKQIHESIDRSEEDEDLNIKDKSVTLAFGQRLKTALRDVWKDSASDVFNIGSQEEVLRVDGLSEELGTIQSIRSIQFWA
jgi:cohesin loading factor subunit SCC2